MTSYSNIFTGNVVSVAYPSYALYSLTALNSPLTLQFPGSFTDSSYVTAAITEINPTSGGRSILLTSALSISVGYIVLFRNVGAFSFDVKDVGGNVLISVGAGAAINLYLVDNSTANGTWHNYPANAAGAGTVTSIGLQSLSAGLVVGGSASPITGAGTFTLTLGGGAGAINTLLAGAGLGYIVQTGVNTVTNRSFTTGNTNIVITNANGVAGNTDHTLTADLTAIHSITMTDMVLINNGISTIAANHDLLLTPNGTGTVMVNNSSGIGIQNTAAYGANYIGFKLFAAPAVTTVYTLPPTDASGAGGGALSSNGVGNLNFATLPGRNRIINGDMQIWQRAAGGAASIAVAATTKYTADRWVTQTSAATNVTVTQQNISTSGRWYARVQRDAANAGVGVIYFVTSLTRDMCVGAAGNKVSLSFNSIGGANFSAAGGLLGVQIVSGTGNADISVLSGFTGVNVESNTTVLINSSLTYHGVTTAAALGNTVTQLAVEFFYTPVVVAGAADWFGVTDVQLEISQVPTPYDRKPFEIQLIDCQYFYQKSFTYATAPAQNVGVNTGEFTYIATVVAAATNRASFCPYQRTMRSPGATPVFYSPAAASAQPYDETAAGACTALTIASATEKGFNIGCTANAGTAIGNAIGVHWTADMELV